MLIPRGVHAHLVGLVLVVLAPVAGLVVYVALEQRQDASESALQESLRVARLISAEHERMIAGTQTLLTTFANLPDIRSGDAVRCDALLAEVLARNNRYLNFGTVDLDGNVMCSALPQTEPVNVADRAYFRRTLESSAFAIGDYQVGRITGQPSLNAGLPIVDGTGKPIAVIFAAIDLKAFGALASSARLPTGGEVMLLSPDGVMLSRWPEGAGRVGRGAPGGIVAAIDQAGSAEGTFRATGPDDVERLYAFVAVGDGPGQSVAYLITGFPPSLIYADRKSVV